MSRFSLSLLVLVGLATAGTARANLVPNGDFETGDATHWVLGGAAVITNTVGGGGSFVLHATGDDWNTPLISATEISNNTNFDAFALLGESVRLSFDLKWNATATAQNANVVLIGQNGGAHPDFAGATLVRDPADTGDWQTYFWDFTLSTNVFDNEIEPLGVQFWHEGGGDRDYYVDSISFALVPEPASLALLGAGGLLLATRRRTDR